MTELEAVNMLLSVIGEAPVDKLADTVDNEITDASLARKTLKEVKRDVLAEGWGWNTDYAVKLTPDSNDEYVLDVSFLKVIFWPSIYPNKEYVARGLKVYDRNARKFDFGDEVKKLTISQVVVDLKWDLVPHAAQQYIAIRAARIYADRFVNSNAIYAYTVQDEEYARAMLVRAEETEGDNNLLWGNSLGAGQGMGYLPMQGLRYRGN